MFKDPSGAVSATRFVFLAWSLGVLLVWGYASFEGKKMATIDPTIVTMIGIFMTGKVAQTYTEGKETTPVVDPAAAPK